MAVRAKVRKYGRGYWIYIPKTIMRLVDEPECFEISVEGKKIVLSPTKN